MSEKKELVLDDGRIESIQYQSPEQLYEDLILRVKKYHPSDDISLIEKAYKVASEAHKDQLRKSGEPYNSSPVCGNHTGGSRDGQGNHCGRSFT